VGGQEWCCSFTQRRPGGQSITSFEDSRFKVFSAAEKSANGADVVYDPTPTRRLESEYRIEGEYSGRGFPPLNDGITYSPEHNVLFGAGPGGVYMYNGTPPNELLGFLRLDDLNTNNVVGGGYLWMTVNQNSCAFHWQMQRQPRRPCLRHRRPKVMVIVVLRRAITYRTHSLCSSFRSLCSC
jgi:hypothetical protein